MVRNLPRPLRRLSVAGERGYTLIETLVVMSLLLIVIGGVVDGYVSASRTEVDQTARADDQESARQALERMRRDIHCATGAIVDNTTDASNNPTSTLSLTVNPGQCIGVTTSTGQSNGVLWCTVSVGGSASRYQLFRTVAGNCDPSQAVFEVDYVTKPAIWTTACSPVHLTTVGIDLAVSRDPATRPAYELTDSIALRNDSVVSGCQPG